MQLAYSFIIPVFNRPGEIRELLESMEGLLGEVPYEVVVVEDGSQVDSEAVVKEFSGSISYLKKGNSGPGDSRNFGMRNARGNYFLILDSDVVLPENYLLEVDSFLKNHYVDCFGGPDAAMESFSPIQKAIDFAMTSFLTTGGIRGNRKNASKFEPRSFNMGLSKKAFEATGGFGNIHPGEDPDLSLRIRKKGFGTAFAPKAFVYHKRRIGWKKFFAQVNKFGKARPILSQWHPGSDRLVFWLPAVFAVGLFTAIVAWFFGVYFFILMYLLYFLFVFAQATFKNNSIFIGWLSICAVLIQFLGYGLGFLKSVFYVRFLKRKPEDVFPELFF